MFHIDPEEYHSLISNYTVKNRRLNQCILDWTKQSFFIADWKHWLVDWEHLESMMQQLHYSAASFAILEGHSKRELPFLTTA